MAMNEYTTKVKDGYMGALATYGNKSGQHLYGAELSRAIRAALREEVTELRKSAINVSVDTYSGGQHIYVKLKMERSRFAVDRGEFVARAYEVAACHQQPYKYNYNGEIYSQREVEQMEYPEQREVYEAWAGQLYDRYTSDTGEWDSGQYGINHYHFPTRFDDLIMNGEAQAVISKALRIINAFRYDDSNAMVDYFNTNFYYDVTVCWQ